MGITEAVRREWPDSTMDLIQNQMAQNSQESQKSQESQTAQNSQVAQNLA